MREIEEIIRLVCDFLNREKIGYVLVGGLAVSFHGLPRTTMDLDLILRISEDEIPKLAEFLTQKDFWVNAEELKTALREKTHCTILDKKSLFRLDIKGIYTEADRRTFERRIPFEYKGIKIYIATAEDLIASKLLYGSEQDLKDAEAIYIRQFEKLDMKYLEKICKEMGVSRELAKLKRKLKPFLSKEIKTAPIES